MPHIENAMRRSVRRRVGDLVLGGLQQRDIGGDINSAKSTFSSWDGCMAKSYCKWPVIIAIIVGSLIVLSIITCIVRCACCGMSCCCSCFSFLKCCDCCGGCCDGKRNKPHKHLDDSYNPRQGYQAPAPMMGGGLGGKPSPPQYAQFEVGRNGLAVDKPAALHEDALPPMPSWDNAAKKHVEEKDESVELGELDPATGQRVPLMTGAVATGGHSGGTSPVHEMGASPYGSRPGQGVNGNGYMGVSNDPYAMNANGRGYGGTPAPGTTGTAVSGPGRGGYGPHSPVEMPGSGRSYGPPSPQGSYHGSNGFNNAAVGGYGPRGPPQRQYSNDSNRPLNPGRQYSDRPYDNNFDNFQPQQGPRGPSRGQGVPRLASPPLSNNSGFDFNAPSSRPSPPPQTMAYGSSQSVGTNNGTYYAGSTAPPSYASRSPPPQQDAGYPGYRPYQPTQGQGGRGMGGAPATLTPGRREPERWDPVRR